MQATKSFCFLFAVSLSIALKAQTEDSVSVIREDTLRWFEKPIYQDLGIYGQISRQFAPTPGGTQMSSWITMGAQVKRLSGGAYIAIYEEEYQGILIFPNQFRMNYLHGGGFLSYAVIQNKWIQLNGTLSLGGGDVIWERSTTYENYFRDTFTMIQALVDLELIRPLPFVRPIAHFGYRRMTPLDLPLITSKDFTGWTMIFGIKIGLFTKSSSR